MQKFKKIILGLTLISGVILFASWGYEGHRKISTPSVSYLPLGMDFLKATWTTFIRDHASDADYRKDTDPTEAPKHYIDIDNYQEFNLTGKIPMSWDSVNLLHGNAFVMDNGILPWATRTAFDSVKACFERKNWDKAALYAADLGHYVADGHMPLHITKNYNGQFTGQTGVHSRYETKMINAYVSQIIYSSDTAQVIQDVTGYIFTYLYHNYIYVDSVLYADHQAFVIAGSTTAPGFLPALWDSAQSFTVPLFRNASLALANLIYTAWVQAGSPNPTSAINEPFSSILKEIYPNPCRDSAVIPFEITNPDAMVTLQLIDEKGNLLQTLVNEKMTRGEHQYIWHTNGRSQGLYYLVLSSEGLFSVQKVIHVK